MGATSANATPLRAVPPKGKGQLRLYTLWVVGGTTGANTVQTSQTSTNFVSDGDTGTTGEYTFTLPGKGGCSIATVHADYEGPDTDKYVTVQSRVDSTRKITLEVRQHSDDAAANLDADEYLNLTVLVTDV